MILRKRVLWVPGLFCMLPLLSLCLHTTPHNQIDIGSCCLLAMGMGRMGTGSYTWNGRAVLGGMATGCPPGRSLPEVDSDGLETFVSFLFYLLTSRFQILFCLLSLLLLFPNTHPRSLNFVSWQDTLLSPLVGGKLERIILHRKKNEILTFL
jgi:hypothetical protein